MIKNNQSLEELILISLRSALRKKSHCSYGDLVNECFTLFPNEFSLTDYPNWPDSLKLDRPLRSLTHEKRFIKGSPKTFYLLTSIGLEELSRVKSITPNAIKMTSITTRSPALTTLKEINQSEEFKKFLQDKENYTPNNMRIRHLIKFTLETPTKVVNQLLTYLLKTTEAAKKNDLEDFLRSYINFYKKGGK